VNQHLNGAVSDAASVRHPFGPDHLSGNLTRPSVRQEERLSALEDRVRRLGQAASGAEGKLNPLGAATEDAARSVRHGDDSSGATQTAGGELQRVREETIDAAGDELDDLKT